MLVLLGRTREGTVPRPGPLGGRGVSLGAALLKRGALWQRVAIAGDAECAVRSLAPRPGPAPLHFILLATSE